MMIKVFSVEEMKKIEQITCENKELTEKDLMYQAGYVLAKDFLSRVMPDINQEILVLANVGNNGGDAIAMFIELQKIGYNVKLFVIGNPESGSEAFSFYYQKVMTDLKFLMIENYDQAIKNTSFIVDGLFGIGLNREVSGEHYKIISAINKSKAIVYSIDLPSGINPDNGMVLKAAVIADFTGVLGTYKLGNLLNDALDYHGDIKVLDIGLMEGYSDVYLLDYKDIDVARKRVHNSNKYTYGCNAYIGSSAMPGAINLSAIAAMKAGLGLAEVFYDEEVIRFEKEIIYRSLSEDVDVKRYDVVCFGPGISEDKKAFQDVLKKAIDLNKKIVVDAGGLKYLDLSKNYHNLICTPHLGEFSKMLKVDSNHIKKDPIHYLRSVAKSGLVMLLKGPTTIIQEQRYTYLIQSRNTGLATAGSGDVLTGIISSLFVEETSINAVVKAVAIQAIAADYAKQKFGEVSMMASDVVNNIYKVWAKKR